MADRTWQSFCNVHDVDMRAKYEFKNTSIYICVCFIHSWVAEHEHETSWEFHLFLFKRPGRVTPTANPPAPRWGRRLASCKMPQGHQASEGLRKSPSVVDMEESIYYPLTNKGIIELWNYGFIVHELWNYGIMKWWNDGMMDMSCGYVHRLCTHFG